MKYFYKIQDNKAVLGSGTKLPNNTFIEYDKANKPRELIDALAYKSIKEQAKEINKTIQKHLDSKAQEFRYDNIMSARSYAGYENPFQEEAQSLAVWASNCGVKAGEIEAEVKAGDRKMPTADEVLAELQKFEEWQ